MPIKTRIDMLATGIKTPVGIKVLGPDLQVLAGLAEQIEAKLHNLPGTASVFAERVTGGNFLDIKIRRPLAARFGIEVADIDEVISSAVGGMNVGHTVEGLERYPINVRYPREERESLESIRGVLVHSPMGHYVPLGELADLKFVKGPPVIKSEGSRPTAWIYVDVSGKDIGGYVARARDLIEREVKLPAGYNLVWSGQFEYMQRAAARLRMIVPVTLLLVFLLLYLNFRNLRAPLMVMLLLPVSLTGGMWLTWILGYQLSVAVGVGFIALAGVSAETAVVMLVYLDQAMREESAGQATRASVDDAILKGAAERLRPKMMTVSAIIFGLLPVMWSAGAGASVMKRVAAPMIGGMLTSALVTLLVLPIVYQLIIGRRRLRGGSPEALKGQAV
jgi:Cu(I)/Ag(I) efflux system membrane protein CusA/SilA